MEFAQPSGKNPTEEITSVTTKPSSDEAKLPVSKEEFIKAFNEIFGSLRGDNIAEVNDKIKQIENDEELKRLRKKIKKNQTEKAKSTQPESVADLASRLNLYLNDFKKVLDEHSQAKTTFVRLRADKEKLIQENEKVITAKNRLDGLSRTLQKQNQDYFENHKRIIEEEKNKRQTLAESFQKKIKEIYSKLEENNLARQQKIRENEILKEKSKEVEHHYETREVLFSTEMKKKELESQIHETQLEQKLLMIENESNLKGSYREQLDKAKESEKIVADKLKIYVDKCSEFQDLMQISNDSFVKFKKDMDKLTQKIKNLDTSNINSQRKIEKSDVAVIDMLTENKKLQKDLSTHISQIELFTSLQKKLEENIKSKEEEIKGLKDK